MSETSKTGNEIPPGVSTRERLTKEAKELLGTLRKMDRQISPSDPPFLISSGQGENEWAILNAPVDIIPEKGEGTKSARIMITTEGILALDPRGLSDRDYIVAMQEAIKRGSQIEIRANPPEHIVISAKVSDQTEDTISTVSILHSDFRGKEAVEEAMKKSYEKATENQKKLDLFQGLNRFAQTALGKTQTPPSQSEPQGPTGAGPSL